MPETDPAAKWVTRALDVVVTGYVLFMLWHEVKDRPTVLIWRARAGARWARAVERYRCHDCDEATANKVEWEAMQHDDAVFDEAVKVVTDGE